MKKIILASTSPRRHEILSNAGIIFETKKPLYNEDMINKSFSYEFIENVAENKGLSIMEQCDRDTVIISADTVVVYDNIVLGKPQDYEEAFNMLKKLSGNTHKVVSAVCIIDNSTKKRIIKSETSEVTFNKLTTGMIEEYIIKFKPYDKAGSYGIQELDENFVQKINGDYNNIVGLPLNLVKSMLNEEILL